MTMMFYFYVGYLVGLDANGACLGLGTNPNAKPGESRFRWYWCAQFPWWFTPANVKSYLRNRRLQRKYDRAHGGWRSSK